MRALPHLFIMPWPSTGTSRKSPQCGRLEAARLRLKCDGTSAETRFRLYAKRTSPFKSAGVSVQSTTGSRAVHFSLRGLYCSCKSVFCSHVTLTDYALHSHFSPSLLLPCITVFHHISTGLYYCWFRTGDDNFATYPHWAERPWLLETVDTTTCVASRRHKHGDYPTLNDGCWLSALWSTQLNHRNNSLFKREFPLTSRVQIWTLKREFPLTFSVLIWTLNPSVWNDELCSS